MTHLMPSSRVLHLLDAAPSVWVAAWIELGMTIGVNAAQGGRAIPRVGHLLRSLGGVPLIGGQRVRVPLRSSGPERSRRGRGR